ncbi:unnamed protein product [Clonostachys byssicola]|uniref:Uncharacterized protein n=1 Tax=Clonostachys byssicola TaxID=160290 RepID=A0A9N9UBI6_9HYPO|nr:unnamed protein product [Clonostachys byssicola]
MSLAPYPIRRASLTQALIDMPKPYEGEPERYRLTANQPVPPPRKRMSFWFRTRWVRTLSRPVHRDTVDLLHAEVKPPPLVVRLPLKMLRFLPEAATIWAQKHFPEWFLPSTLVVKCRRQNDPEHVTWLPADQEPPYLSKFDAEIRTYNQLKELQGITIPKFLGRTICRDKHAMLLQDVPGAYLSNPDGATLTYDELRDLLERCFYDLSEFSAVQTNPSTRNFVVSPDRQSLTAVDLENIHIGYPEPTLLDFDSLCTQGGVTRKYVGSQRFYRQEGYLEPA